MRKLIFPLFLLILIVLVSSCKEEIKKEIPLKVLEGTAQGTTYQVMIFDSSTYNFKKGIDSLLLEIDQSLSTYNPHSILSQFNHADSCMIVDGYFLDVFFEAHKVYTTTNGAFDPTILPMLNVWGFGPNDPMKFDSTYSDSMIYAYRDSLSFELTDFVGMDKLNLDGDLFYSDTEKSGGSDNYVCKIDSHVQVDFNAIAQGYSVDRIALLLDQKGVKSYLVELGGELKSKGYKPNAIPWKVGLEDPFKINEQDKHYSATVVLKNRAMAISGNYRKVTYLDNKKVTHTIDPRKGNPIVNNLVSVAVFADDCIQADAYATAFMVMGVYDAVDFIENNRTQNLEAFFIFMDDKDSSKVQTYTTWGLEDKLENIIDPKE